MSITEAAAAAPCLLKLRGLRTVMDGRTIHNGVDLDIHASEIVVLLGGSGTGKTTLLRTLVGLETPAGGSCEFNQRDLFSLDEKDWPEVRTQIAYAFQGGALFDSLTVLENLEFPLKEHTCLGKPERLALILNQLESLGLGRIEQLRPSELSGGMQKRVGVARAIILNPKIVLYDEPTAGLDPENIRRINDTILRLKAQGKTSIVVTHDPLCALEVADRFVLLANGQIAVEQSRSEFEMNPHPLLSAYFSGAATH